MNTRGIDNTMNKLKIYLSLAFLFLGVFIIEAQDNYYYYKAKKTPLTLDKRSVNVSLFDNLRKSSLKNLNIKKLNLQTSQTSSYSNGKNIKYGTIEYQSTPSDSEYAQKIKALKKLENLRTVSPNFMDNQGTKIGMSDYFYVKLKKASDFEKLQQLADKIGVNIIEQNEFMPLWYTLRCTENTKGNTLKVANYFFETGLFSSSSPDFLVKYNTACTNDPEFHELWGLNYDAGINNVNINICDAWKITEGKGVQVALLDTGIELTHIDLADNISSLSYNTESNSSPSQIINNESHGTHMAGTIAAVKDNNLQVVGVAPQSTLISISNALDETPNSRMKRVDGINWAWQHGADIINNSWVISPQFDAINNAINNALTKGRNGKGTVMVFASGNDYGAVSFPANSNPDIISVGSVNYTGVRSNFSNYGNELDLVAPGEYILSTTLDNYTDFLSGTSSATAHVSGVAALVLSANPSLNVDEVRDIIEQTAQKIRAETYTYLKHLGRPNGTWNNEMGYGLIDAHAAVELAQQKLDLYIKDFLDDLGVEPDPIPGKIWRSTGIWVRNTPDGIQEHQNPKYGSTNYLYAKITNISSVSSTANEQLKLYWSKAGTGLRWPKSWDGTLYNHGVLMGAPIRTLTIPVLAPGEEVVLSTPWQMPNPNDYIDINPSPWHFCFLARIVSDSDPMTIKETRWMSANARNNNNIAWKNVIAVKASSNSNTRKRGVDFDNTRSFGGVISVENPFDDQRTFSLELVKEDLEGGKAIFDEAEVAITMDQTLYNAWARAGSKSELIERTHNKNKKLVRGNHALLDRLTFKPNQTGTLNLTFNFLTRELTDKTRFVYHVIQRDATTGETIGGETYIITKDSRPLFVADAGEDQFTNKNEAVTIRAKQLEEVAVYNWYDAQGKLIHKGRDLRVSPEATQKYKLEVIASDGFKDYDEVEVKLSSGSFKDSYLDKIIPNPVTGTARITYNLGGAKSAYLMVVGFYYGATKTSNNYILEAGSQDTTIQMDNYLDGYYKVALVCDGKDCRHENVG